MDELRAVICGCLLAAALSAASSPAGAAPARAAPARDEGRFSPASMAYVLQAERLGGGREGAVRKLAACGRDLVVIDHSYDGSREGKWAREEVGRIRSGMPGRKVVSYISIGEAEDYRAYWKRAWDRDRDGRPDRGAPGFLCEVNPDWEGNYKVRYWREDWQSVILAYVDEIVEQGFDGVYLDIVDAFEFFEEEGGRWIDHRPNPETGNTYREDMIAWIRKIAAHARAEGGVRFLVIPQNGAQLLASADYLRAADAIAVEDLFTNGGRKQKEGDVRHILGHLRRARAAGKPVLVVEYPRKRELETHATRRAAEHGFVLLVTGRELGTLGECPLADVRR